MVTMNTDRDKIARFLTEAYTLLTAADVLLRRREFEVLSHEGLAANRLPGVIGTLEDLMDAFPEKPTN